MTRALTYKEIRETLGVVAIGLVALLIIPASRSAYNPIRGLVADYYYHIPFASDSFNSRLAMVGFAFAVALGFWQAIGDFRGDAQLFVLHRPVSRRRIYAVKLAVGLTAFLACGVASILVYALWAATPGNHASPFEWSMTSLAWKILFALTAVYFGAVLSGIRPAAWIGTRLAPLAAAAAVYGLALAPLPYPAGWGMIVLADVVLSACILFVVAHRDFA
jgi:hypothetical protein